MELNLFSAFYEIVGKMDVPSDIFDIEYNDILIHQVIVSYLSKARLGTKSQKSRHDVRGGGIKPWRQKGTGRARAGTIRSPLWRGGGVTFASKPRNYYKKINKKMYKKAICSIFSELIRNNRLIVIDDIIFSDFKTKNMVKFIDFFKVKNVLIIMKICNNNLLLSSRNLHNVVIQKVNYINPVYLIKYEKVIITKEAMIYLCEILR